jgi:hypothetical protein
MAELEARRKKADPKIRGSLLKKQGQSAKKTRAEADIPNESVVVAVRKSWC